VIRVHARGALGSRARSEPVGKARRLAPVREHAASRCRWGNGGMPGRVRVGTEQLLRDEGVSGLRRDGGKALALVRHRGARLGWRDSVSGEKGAGYGRAVIDRRSSWVSSWTLLTWGM
jgi:hypothetical protein